MLMSINQSTNMPHKSLAKITTINRRLAVGLFALVASFAMLIPPLASADRFQDQINELQSQNNQTQSQVNSLQIEAESLQATIDSLQAQINAMQAQIIANQAKRDQLKKEIAEAEAELAKQKALLGENIKAMYLEGKISTLEMLASSKDLSDFVDKQQYRDSVKTKIKNTVDKVTALKIKLKDQKTEVEQLLAEQDAIKKQLGVQQSEQARLLGLNSAQQQELDGQIQANNEKIASLRAQQAAENARLFGAGGIPAGTPGGGGYPGVWAFAPMNAYLDSWGMYSRQCVSYTAWKVASTGRYMPGWGWLGIGNANQWDDNAIAAGIPTDYNPRVGDVAVSNYGYYGHVMYVEQVGSDGSLLVSDYNQQWDGLYRLYWISAATVQSRNLIFIHF
jgi:peptidoglycan DL-endopeptidase CwlO